MNENDVVIGRVISIDANYINSPPHDHFVIVSCVPLDSIPGLHNIYVRSLITGYRYSVRFYHIENLIKWE